ncbi:SCAN domain-containing protein 3 [Eumeta japonica]|uniref:SCAN domain-containing protein 3 n=1 Tax=Eumeta variegata TaxID=151549 RepID=A0A4C1SLS4_EUMVA|nr:SCAN domain-containing protein 3 [Eumeta japonica]
MVAKDGLPFRVFCTSEDMKNLFAAKGNNYKLPSSPNTIELIVMNYGMTLKMKMKEDLLKLKNEDYRFTVILDEWTSGINQRFLNVNVHTVINCQPTYWNIGLARIFGSMSSESCVQVLKEKLSEFDLSLDKDIVGITTDGASVMKKVGRLIEPLLQLCYAHGVQLGITDVIYKKTVQSNPEEEFEDPELNTNRSAEEKEVLGDNPDNYDANKAEINTTVLNEDDLPLSMIAEDLSLRAIAAQNYTSLQEELEETLRASKTESPFKPVSTSLDSSRIPGSGAHVSLRKARQTLPARLVAHGRDVATDGAPAMVERYRGFVSHLKRIIPGLTAIHCVIHRQHLVVKHLSDRLNQSLHFVIKAVNKIRRNALNTCLFAQLCDENDEDFQRLLLHTEVRWLSEGACLTRFYSVFDSVLEFLESRDPDLKEKLIKFKADIAYLTDLFKKFNYINLQLQGDSLNLIKTKGIISAFLGKLKFMKQNISRREFSQFPNLSQIECIDEDIHTYSQHLSALHDTKPGLKICWRWIYHHES